MKLLDIIQFMLPSLFVLETCVEGVTDHVLHSDRLVFIQIIVKCLAVVFSGYHIFVKSLQHEIEALQIFFEFNLVTFGDAEVHSHLLHVGNFELSFLHPREQLVYVSFMVLRDHSQVCDERQLLVLLFSQGLAVVVQICVYLIHILHKCIVLHDHLAL